MVAHRFDDVPALPPPATEVSKRPNPIERAAHVWRYRELLGNLIRKELKVKYKNSALGFVWTLLNPILYLVVFSLVFAEVLRVNIPYYAIFFLSGLLAWNLFSTGLSTGTASIVGNSQLVQKVWFPREILPLSTLGAAAVHFFLQLLVLAGAMIAFGRAPAWNYFPVLLLATIAMFILCAGLSIALSSVNVYLRDTEHLLELALLAWFWLSAIVYPYQLVIDRLGPDLEWVASLNPMIPIITTFQKTLYNPQAPFLWYTNVEGQVTGREQAVPAIPMDHDMSWFVTHVSIVTVGATITLLVALWLFGRLEDNLAEEI